MINDLGGKWFVRSTAHTPDAYDRYISANRYDLRWYLSGRRWTLQAWLSSNGASSIAPANKLTRWLISGTDDKGSPHCGEVRRRDPGFRPQALHRRTVPYLNVSVQPPRHSYSFRRGVGFSFHLAPPVTKRIVAPRDSMSSGPFNAPQKV